MAREETKTELMVGLFLLIGLLLLGGVILQFGNVREWFKDKYSITVTFSDASGIGNGSVVTLGGARVGVVEKRPELNESFTGVDVPIALFKGVQVPEGSVFRVANIGLMGDAFIEILPPAERTAQFIQPGDELVGDTGTGIEALAGTVRDVGSMATLVMEDIRGSVAELTASLTTVNEGILAQQNVEHVSKALASLDSALGRFDQEVLGDENVAAVNEALTGVRDAAKTLGEAIEGLQPTLDKLDGTLDELPEAMADAREAIRRFGNAAETIEETAKSLQVAGGELATALGLVHKGDGLIAALLTDEDLKTEFKFLISNMRQRGVLFYRDIEGRADDDEVETGPRGTFPGSTNTRTGQRRR